MYTKMNYIVQLDNGIYGTIDKTNYDFLLSVTCSILITMCIYHYINTLFNMANTIDNSNSSKCYNNEEHNTQSDTQSDTQSNYILKQTKSENYITQSQELNEYFNNLPEESKPTQLGDRMKFYEKYTDKYIAEIDPYTSYIIRIDGRSFSKLLSGIKQNEFNSIQSPFINDFKLAMDRTTADLVKEFNASTGYNHSDEISLVFKPMNENTDDELIKEHQFNGRINKLISLIASYASIRLSYHLRNINYEKFCIMFDRVTFDARAIIFPDDTEICNYFVWRSHHDCFHNFVSELCYKHFPKKSLDKLNTSQRIEKLKQERILDINDFNPFLRNGTFVKRELVSHKEGEQTYWRNSYVRFALTKFECNTDYLDLIKCKNFQEWEFQNIEFELLGEF